MKKNKKEDLEKLFEPYVSLVRLECDGMTRVCSYLLNKAKIKHKVFYGSILSETYGSFFPHYWIVCGDYIIDYRARMWLGNYDEIPHGVFVPVASADVKYQGNEIEMEVGDLMFRILTSC